MPKRFPWIVSAIALLVCAMVLPGALLAQYGSSTGSIIGRVVDEQGGVLPGVSVIVKGPGAPVTMYSDARGEFRVTNIDAGVYTLTVALQGFSTVNRENVVVQLGKNTELTVSMKLSAVAATVTVTGEAPILETKRVSTGSQISQQELASIPTARDPWVVLQSVPGVEIDRVNVAGSESGQQSVFMSHGSSMGTFAVDGVNFTDMSALGASAGYYDFDSFQEMQVLTGGSDASIAGTGTHLNMVTKRGTNEVHGSARLYEVDHHFQSTNLPSGGAVGIAAGNHINSITDTGAEVGGPVVKDTLWLWGSYGRDQINLVTANGLLDRTTLENFNAKINWQVVPSNAADVWYQRSDKLKFGRSAGLTRTQPTSWDQTTPQNTWKFEDSQIIGSNLFFTAAYNGANGNFTLTPQGGIATQAYVDEGSVWHNSYYYGAFPRPTRQVKGDVSYFFNTGSVGNELKAGFGYLTAANQSFGAWPGDGSNGLAAETYGNREGDCAFPDGSVDCAVVTRNFNQTIKNFYYSAYLQDAITMDRLTVNLGVRWDRQYGNNYPSLVPANASFPDILPALNYPGQEKPFTWNDWQPRVGLTYALGPNRNTVFKASYARYAEALGTLTTSWVSPTSQIAYAYYKWNDGSGCAGPADNFVQPCEVDTTQRDHAVGYNPANPGSISPLNNFGPDFHAPRTDEFVAGVDHELFPAFAVGAVYTYRKFKSQLFRFPTGVTQADYVQYRTVSGTLPDGTAYSAPVFELACSQLDPVPAGCIPPGYTFTNRPDYNQTYNGVDLILTKRLSNKWMMRGSFTWNNNKQHVGANGCVDPTNIVPGQSSDGGGGGNPATSYTAANCADNEIVAIRSTGSGNKSGVFLNSKWQFNVNGLYQLPLNFNVAGSIYGRQGYPIDWFRRAVGDDGYVRDVSVVGLDDQRYKNVYEVDLRLEKVIPITATSNVTVSADCFNVTNQGTILQIFNRLSRSNTNDIKELQSPRIWRFGARISF